MSIPRAHHLTPDRQIARRSTRQRAAVRALLAEVDEFRSAQEVHGLLEERAQGVSLRTVYRALSAMADEGTIDVGRRGDGEAVYRRSDSGARHHHLVCRRCDLVVEIDSPAAQVSAVQAWANAVAVANDFDDVTTAVELVGICADCRASYR